MHNMCVCVCVFVCVCVCVCVCVYFCGTLELLTGHCDKSAQSTDRSGHTDDSGVHKVQLGVDLLMTVGCTKYR